MIIHVCIVIDLDESKINIPIQSNPKVNTIYSRQRKEYECWIFLSTGKVLRTYCESLTLKNVKACLRIKLINNIVYQATWLLSTATIVSHKAPPDMLVIRQMQLDRKQILPTIQHLQLNRRQLFTFYSAFLAG